ncbi:hypothetical protein [Apilactobacillus timberlakei]|uniref:Uncharacterized protein n=1 Tax=Apilactobacillus timberlakei TaxID=2008380 RepID=A0ABY2YUD3_9LACO|nr:hypothetical protein [Apilactobacillus timberlakei]TPR13138.1 hypothetical protein DYZ97_04425 [Apilactobacillus timberlakei]TPR14188.1 hypothetical protein DY048_04375 [Apilactobacillus timberlakei]TPR16441.1 hypothetical protein DY052_02465 [Apilactobacillus timberlakei]
MEKTSINQTLLNLKRTRSHLLNAFDNTNAKINVISDIDNLVSYLKQNNNINQAHVDNKIRIIKGEINCSMHCFTNAMKSLS